MHLISPLLYILTVHVGLQSQILSAEHYCFAYSNTDTPANHVLLYIYILYIIGWSSILLLLSTPGLAQSPPALSSNRGVTAETVCDDGRVRLHNIRSVTT